MASANFYVVYIQRKEGKTLDDVKKKMDLSRSWYRLSERCWVLYTTSDIDKWYSRLSPLVLETGNLLIAKIDLDSAQGWLDQNFWDWFRKRKSITSSKN